MIRRSKRASRTLRAVVCLSRERRRCLIKRDRQLRSHRLKRVSTETERVERVAWNSAIGEIGAETVTFARKSVRDIHKPRNLPAFSGRIHRIVVMTAR